ncbi:hypothetical protein EIB18_03980 [Caulobacter vibrioides]|uniref:TonB superfamily protein n=1 Tax=Caulobacter vibrioides (strain NA1000 / CB15N) TaxID=565050 RepID=A0A0H3C7S7_CAUVN|nr:energy transducer TonB [Caulobacter vibrioides]YP_002516152.2 TonB superfamily protein [Caulobacter vibrioides NA1000]QBQ56946.1 hypothetical protein EUX21_00780 [synthetic Caulobacter sp. 'ethensis']ACL94244.2 TonB superfamily protein [Caulobacter vibrioides NA1000]ATC23705.1 hypothetical protein CA608_03740 [Caulobacter vibrioides]ATC27582.1 hypothetical protein CA607_03945 [Caulobacter vibrioides]AZH11953.1 hypothetical protein EIB18_03980 [Caulobacter vibrioides]
MGRKRGITAVVLAALALYGAPVGAQAPKAGLPPLKILKAPSPELLARLFPATARRAGVEGAATVQCTIRRDGTLGDCVVTGENPQGLGFGGAALIAMTYYQVDVSGTNAVQVSRRLSGITIRFALPPVETRSP